MNERNPAGLGGWLSVVAAFQVIYVLQQLHQSWALLNRDPVWTPFVLGEAVGQLINPLFVLYCTALLFWKRRAFPRMFVIQLWLIAGTNIVGIALVAAKIRVPHAMAIEIGMVVWNVAFAVIWTLYTLKSVRVRNTFVT